MQMKKHKRSQEWLEALVVPRVRSFKPPKWRKVRVNIVWWWDGIVETQEEEEEEEEEEKGGGEWFTCT